MQELINKIHLGDCLDFMHKLPDKCIDLAFVDPEYGIGIDKMNFTNSTEGGVAKRNDYKNCFKDVRPSPTYFKELFRISKNQIIFGGNYFTKDLSETSSWIVWNKKGDGRFSNDFADGEMAWNSFNKPLKIYHFLWSGMIQENMKEKEKRVHPCQKPVKLYEMILRDFSSDDDIIIDTHSGSGTTAIACHNLKRNFICIEKDPDYYKASVERLAIAQSQQKLF